MRTRMGLAALAAAFLLSRPAWAQTALTFGGADPTKLVNQVIQLPDSSSMPIAQPQQAASTGFSLTGMLSKFGLPSASKIFGQSIFPTQQNMPGKSYLQNFGYRKAQPIED
jgi:hypothetical protein